MWKVDSTTSMCDLCFAKFTLLKRKHHCRKCGTIVCNDCSSNRALLTHVDAIEKVRICDNCFVYNIGTLNVGIGVGEGESKDYTVDLNRIVNDSVDYDTQSSFNESIFSGRSSGSKGLSHASTPNRNSTPSTRYRDSLNKAEVKCIEANTKAKGKETGSSSCFDIFGLFFACFCVRKDKGHHLDSNQISDPLITK